MNPSSTLSPGVLSLAAGSGVVILWFLWPFTALTWADLAYASLVGGALFLIAWYAADAVVANLRDGWFVRLLAMGSMAFVIGMGAQVGYAFSRTGLLVDDFLAQAGPRLLDATACVVGALVALALTRRKVRGAD